MIDPADQNLSIFRQCRLLNINRSTYYYKKRPIKPIDLKLMELIDKQYLKTPPWGSRSMRNHLRRLGYQVNRKRVQRLMRLMGLEAIYPKRKTSRPHPAHKVYPYLLRNLKIDRPNQVWAADITYVPMSRGFMYLVAVMDWNSRKVLSWRLSNTLDTDFCIEALQEAINCFGTPEIFNTDQGAQFTSNAFTKKSAWTAGAVFRTIFSLNVCGGRLNTIIFICMPLTMVRSCATGSTSGSAFTIRTAFTRPLTI